jgi:hypothetical protein
MTAPLRGPLSESKGPGRLVRRDSCPQLRRAARPVSARVRRAARPVRAAHESRPGGSDAGRE